MSSVNETLLFVSYTKQLDNRAMSRKEAEELVSRVRMNQTGLNTLGFQKVYKELSVCSILKKGYKEYEAYLKKPLKCTIKFNSETGLHEKTDNYFPEKDDVNCVVEFRGHYFLFTNFAQIFYKKMTSKVEDPWTKMEGVKYNRYYCKSSPI